MKQGAARCRHMIEEDAPDILRVLGYRKGWLICKLPDGFLHGIIWDDGSFHAGCILNDKTGFPVMRMSRRGNYTVKGAIKLHHDSLGFALPVTDRFQQWTIGDGEISI